MAILPSLLCQNSLFLCPEKTYVIALRIHLDIINLVTSAKSFIAPEGNIWVFTEFGMKCL